MSTRMQDAQRFAPETVSVPNERLVDLAEHLVGGWATLQGQLDEQGRIIQGRLEAVAQHNEHTVLLTLTRRMRNHYRGRVPAVETVEVTDGRAVSVSPACGTKPAARTCVDLPWPTVDVVFRALER